MADGEGTQEGQQGQEGQQQQQEDRSKWSPEKWKEFAEGQENAAKTATSQLTEANSKISKFEADKTKADEQKRKDDENKLREQGEHQKLAEQYKGELDQVKPQLETANATIKELTGLLNSQIDTETKDWPAEIKAMDPGPDAPLKVRSEWKDKAAKVVEKMGLTGQAAGRGTNGPNPPAAGAATPNAEKAREAHARNYANA